MVTPVNDWGEVDGWSPHTGRHINVSRQQHTAVVAHYADARSASESTAAVTLLNDIYITAQIHLFTIAADRNTRTVQRDINLTHGSKLRVISGDNDTD